MSNTPEGGPFGPRPEMPPATHVPDDRTGASGPPTWPHAPAPPPVRRSPNHRWWWLVAAGVLLLVGASGGLTGWGRGGGPFTGSTEQRQTYRGEFTALDFTGGSGDVQVTGGAAAGTVEVTRRLRWGMGHGQPNPQEQVRGTTLVIDSRCGGGFMSMCSMDYEVVVPDRTQVTLGVGSGDITISGVLGAVQAQTGSGNIDGNALSAADTTLRTGSGDVNLAFTSPPSRVDLRTGSGDVDVFVPKKDAYAVTVSTGSGNKSLGIDTSQSSSRSIHVETGSGDITLDYR